MYYLAQQDTLHNSSTIVTYLRMRNHLKIRTGVHLEFAHMLHYSRSIFARNDTTVFVSRATKIRTIHNTVAKLKVI